MNRLGNAHERLTLPPVDPQHVGQGRQIAGRYQRLFREVTHRPRIVVSRIDGLKAGSRLVSYASYWHYSYIMTVICVFRPVLALDY